MPCRVNSRGRGMMALIAMPMLEDVHLSSFKAANFQRVQLHAATMLPPCCQMLPRATKFYNMLQQVSFGALAARALRRLPTAVRTTSSR
eukprot:15884-Pleurochrysis_carterae.AAC.2